MVSGPKGTLTFELPAGIDIIEDDSHIRVTRESDNKELKAKHGMTRSVLNNMITGVTDGYKITLEIRGVGYRAQASGQQLNLNIGYSHPVKFEVPETVSLTVPTNTQIILESTDKQVIGQTAAKIRAIRPPDSYKGKGIRYEGEQITLKEGKSVG